MLGVRLAEGGGGYVEIQARLLRSCSGHTPLVFGLVVRVSSRGVGCCTMKLNTRFWVIAHHSAFFYIQTDS